MRHVFPNLTEFAEHHEEFWQWVWAVEAGVRPHPFVGIWPRGGGKSFSAEMAAVVLAARGVRSYCLYVSGTQEQAEKHVDSVAALLLSPGIERYYPELANRAVTRHGHSRGWRRNRLTTASGFVIDAVGLRTGTRGMRFEDQRPDFIILDDVDELDDTPETTAKKIATFTSTLLPMGSTDVATLAIQNLIIPDGLFARLDKTGPEPATFLADRQVSGPIPAIRGFDHAIVDGRAIITEGEPTWAGQPLDICQAQINDWGIEAFLAEAQHQPRARGSKIYRREWWADGRNRFVLGDRRLQSFAVARVMSWDTADSLATTAAYSAVVVGDIVPHPNADRGGHALLIREVWRGRVEQPELTDAIERMARRWHFDAPTNRNLQEQVIWIEYASSGRAAYQTMMRVAPDWLRKALRRVTVTVPKDDRAIHAAEYCRTGRVLLPFDAPWLPLFEQELYDVPQAIYRDLTDAFSQLVNMSRNYLMEPHRIRRQEAA